MNRRNALIGMGKTVTALAAFSMVPAVKANFQPVLQIRREGNREIFFIEIPMQYEDKALAIMKAIGKDVYEGRIKSMNTKVPPDDLASGIKAIEVSWELL
jgi:hypothetical protein